MPEPNSIEWYAEQICRYKAECVQATTERDAAVAKAKEAATLLNASQAYVELQKNSLTASARQNEALRAANEQLRRTITAALGSLTGVTTSLSQALAGE